MKRDPPLKADREAEFGSAGFAGRRNKAAPNGGREGRGGEEGSGAEIPQRVLVRFRSGPRNSALRSGGVWNGGGLRSAVRGAEGRSAELGAMGGKRGVPGPMGDVWGRPAL